jgi:LDH2 family malate/lactate/ureidoglycolate dehydrogenase
VVATHPPKGEASRIRAADLVRFSHDVLRAAGFSNDDASLVAEQLVWRDLREEVPVGLAALPSAVEAARRGAGKGTPRIASELGAVAVVAGAGVWGQITAVYAMREAVTRARTHGVGVVSVRDSETANAMGFYPTLAIDAGMVGIIITNSEPYQAPWGGTTKVLGNQAFAMGAPAAKHHPLLFDAAATALSMGRIRSLQRRGLPLPEGGAVDAEGRPTIDPVAAIAGALLPSGGHKGYALSVFWEVLTGVLADDRPAAGRDKHQTSLFVLAIDPRATVGTERFRQSVEELVDRIHSSPPAPGVDRVWAPGERGYVTAQERRATGVPISASRIVELRELGEKLGVKW